MTATAIEAAAGTVVSTAVSLGRVRVTRDRGYSRQGSVSVVRSEDGWPEDICLIFGRFLPVNHLQIEPQIQSDSIIDQIIVYLININKQFNTSLSPVSRCLSLLGCC